MTRPARLALGAALLGLLFLAVVPLAVEQGLFTRRVEAAEGLTPGLTEAEVRACLGEPDRIRRSILTLGKPQWEYEAPRALDKFLGFGFSIDLPKTGSLLVSFDAEGRMTSVRPPREP